jgi:NodT family efflux transporter outer membrane factor (OMF) lipoprotein
MVGPNFHAPEAPKTHRYTETPLPAKTTSTPHAGQAGSSQRFITSKEIPAEWWTLFRSEELNELIMMGLANSPTLDAAKATLRQAQEALNAQIGNLMFPAVTAGLSGTRQRQVSASFAGDLPTTVFNLFNASLNVSYALDVFGGSRRQLESLLAQVDYQQFQLLGAYLTLTSNIVTTAVTAASLDAQIHATKRLVREQVNQLNIMKKQFRLGGIAKTNVLIQETLVNQTKATLPPLQKQFSQARHILSVLVGQTPDKPLPIVKLDKLFLPTRLPVSLPSELVRQRPDVRASEALLHAASAQIGVATANLLPQFIITGNTGYVSDTFSSLFQANNRLWSIGAQITQPIFKGGMLWAQRRGAIAAFDTSAAQYRQTLLQAFQNVADVLRAIETDADAFQAQKAAETSARNNLIITRQQYRDGGVSSLELLNAQQQYQQTRIARIQAQGTRYTDTAALFQALGGGWWNRQECGKDPINPTNVSKTCPA